MNESKPGKCITNEAMPPFPPQRLIPSSKIIDPFEQLMTRIEKIEQWIGRQEQHQAEQDERR